jgi:hypothetical protein
MSEARLCLPGGHVANGYGPAGVPGDERETEIGRQKFNKNLVRIQLEIVGDERGPVGEKPLEGEVDNRSGQLEVKGG